MGYSYPMYIRGNKMDGRCIVIAMAGPSGAGKSSYAEELVKIYGEDQCLVFPQDDYYCDQTNIDEMDRADTNYDIPESIEWELLQKDLQDLMAGKTIQKPQYNFKVHNREVERVATAPKRIIIVEGILVLHVKALRDMCNFRVFVNADLDLVALRRMDRDTDPNGNRKRTFAQAYKQYMTTVRPALINIVLPSQKHADTVINNPHHDDKKIDLASLQGVRDFIDNRLREVSVASTANIRQFNRAGVTPVSTETLKTDEHITMTI